jgi:multiple sugar transport system ATP-binding protein
MNFLEGKLVDDAGALVVDVGGAQLRVPDWARAGMAEHRGRVVVIGVRPQAIAERPFPGGGAGFVLQARVQFVEHLGDKMDVRFTAGTHADLVAHLDANERLRADETLPLHLDPERLHFFAADGDGRALVRRG